ncbi:MAG TPA: two-component regulator propeller domain-containing protein [Ohtaekwangia sp.]|nr:two-component regulator propeller domain-containing protein [Ohtaekwangia sp.]
MMFRCYAFGLLLVLHASLLVQDTNAQSPFFSTLTSRDGLPSNNISAVAQDHHNFLWIGTGNGLCRYDGYRFKTFKREESEKTIPDNEISALLVDGNYLWVGTWRGLCKINTITFEISRIDLKGKNVIRTLYKDKNNTIWIGTTDGLIKHTTHNNQFVNYTAEANKLSHNTVRAIHEDKLGNLWVGTYDKLNKLSPGAKTFQSYNLKGNYKPTLKNNLICDIKPVKNTDSLMWIGTETGLYKLNIYTGNYIHYGSHNLGLSNEVVKSIYTDPEDNVWLGTDFGLNIFNPETDSISTFFHNPQLSYSIGNNVIWQIMEDEGDVIWLVTSNGLSRTNKHKNFYLYHEISHRIGDQTIGNQIKSMLVTSDGIIWIATLHGVIRLNPETRQQELFDIDSPPQKRILLNNVSTISQDDLGRIWIGTAGGINVWDEKSGKMYSITANATNGLASNYISKFTKGQDGSFWVSAWEGGLFKIVHGFDDLDNIRFEYVGDFSSAKNTYALSALWAIHNNELFRIDPNSYVTVKMKTFNTIAKGKDVRSLYYAPQKSIWAGTQNGLIEYKVQKDSAIFYPIITGNDTDLNNITSDQSGNIWAAANNMILKFRTQDYQIEIFPLEKDLPLKTFSPDCVTKTNNGEVIFGGDNGFISLNTNISPNAYKPDVYLTAIEINNKPVFADQHVDDRILLTEDISFTDKIILDYKQRSIAFEFAALHYWQPDMNVYAYKLNGFDKEWNYVSGLKNFAVYSNLSPGDYTLVVKGTNNYGVWNDAVAKLQITVKPPLFLSPPFLIAYGLIVVMMVVIALRIYLARVNLNNELKLARIEKAHAEEIVQTKQQFFTNISHELRTPISLIIPPIQQIIKQGNLDEETHSLISIAEKNAQRLLRLINQILDFRKLEHENQSLTITWFDVVNFSKELYTLFTDKAARKDIDFVFETDLESCPLWADKEKLEIIIFNLLSNAFKFTPKKGRIEFAISKTPQNSKYKHGAVEIRVRDNGAGIAPEEHARIFDQFYQTPDSRKIEDGSGIGLTLVAEYTKLHRGDIRVESQKGIGTCFTVSLPLGDSHFPVDKNQLQKEIDLVATKTLTEKEAAKQTYQFDLRATKPLILLVEDNWDMIHFIQLSLKERFTFIIADNGEEGLAKAHSFVPDLIISDIMMPVMDGVTMCKKIKQDIRISHIPIIMLTAKSLTSQKVEGIRSGADIYMTKPFEIELLEAHIDQLLEKQHELAEYFKNELITQPVNPSGKENEDDKFLRKAMNTIEANISNSDFSVEVLSEEMGMSTTHLYRKLKSLTQLSANEIIKRYRIKKASLLLKNKEGNISEIMYEVGFSNLSYFSKCFKAEFGLTPKEYQQKMSKGSYEIEI